jgi:hypothetical protein
MKSTVRLLVFIMNLPLGFVNAQAVSKAVIVEHFTNSYCSICGSRNPGFYQNLSQFPQVLHIAYYPSAPYPACPFNQYNKPEADARTNFYGVYGSTPRLVVQGKPISTNANYADAAIFQGELGQPSSFAVNLRLSPLTAGVAEARLVITRVNVSTLDSGFVYAAIVQDTVQYSSNNGEQVHYDVFRKSVWGTLPLQVRLPANTGDSVVLMQSFQIDNSWPQNKMYGIGILQQASGLVVQAARSNKLDVGSATGIQNTSIKQSGIYPNPASDFLQLQGVPIATATVYDLQGKSVLHLKADGASRFDVRSLAPGNYILSLSNQNFHFVKQ